MSNIKLNVYKKFNKVEENIKERIEVLCSESKLSAKDVTFCLRIIASFVKILQTSLECSVISLIFFALCLL